MRSMIVGTHWTGDARYGPHPARAGTHAGTEIIGSTGLLRQCASRLLSHPHPGPSGTPGLSGSTKSPRFGPGVKAMFSRFATSLPGSPPASA